MKRKIKSWGEEVWEEKIKKQGEVGVIFGTIKNLFGRGKEISNRHTKKVMIILDKEVLPLIKPNGKILDAGIGPMARFTIEFAKRGYKVVGVDVSKTTLKFAKKYIDKADVKNVKLKQEDIVELNLKERFNLVFCAGTFLHIPSHLGLIVLINFNRILNNNNYALIDFFVKREKTIRKGLFELAFLTVHKIKRKLGRGFYVTGSSYTEDELEDMFSRTGFKFIKKVNGFHLLKKVKKVIDF